MVLSPFSGSRSRETLLHEADKNGEQAMKQFVGEHVRIRSHGKSWTLIRHKNIFLPNHMQGFQLVTELVG